VIGNPGEEAIPYVVLALHEAKVITPEQFPDVARAMLRALTEHGQRLIEGMPGSVSVPLSSSRRSVQFTARERAVFEDVMRHAKLDPKGLPKAIHEAAWQGYRALYGNEQSADRMSERGGFGLYEIVSFLAVAVEKGLVRVEVQP
jgi:hypothetical protein